MLTSSTAHSTEPPAPGTAGPKNTAAAWTAGISGGSGLTVLAYTMARLAAGHAAPAGLWIAFSLLIITALTGCALETILRYKTTAKRIDVDQTRANTEQETARGLIEIGKIHAQTDRERIDIHRLLIEKAIGEPDKASQYTELSDADTRWNAVDKNQHRPLPNPAKRSLATRPQHCAFHRPQHPYSKKHAAH
jgi:hypothetical protein